MKKYLIFTALAAASILCSCKKDETAEAGNYLSGSLSFSLPEFVLNGETYTVQPKGVYNPSAFKSLSDWPDSLGYYVTNPLTNAKDTIKYFPTTSEMVKVIPTYNFKISKSATQQKDTLGTFTISIHAYAPDYYSSTGSRDFTIINPGYGEGCTLRGFVKYAEDGIKPCFGRDFRTTDIDGTAWFRENLSSTSSGRPYKDCDAMDTIYGKYYTWEEARTACPDDWTLPSSADWDALAAKYPNVRSLMGDIGFNSDKKKMWTYWSNVGMPSDESRLTILPTGYASISDGRYIFSKAGSAAYFWTSDGDAANADNGIVRFIDEHENSILSVSMSKKYFAASVRCIKK